MTDPPAIKSWSGTEPKEITELSFVQIAELLEELSTYGRVSAEKARLLRRFLSVEVRRRGEDLFQLFRLLLPKLDHERGYYGIKEKRLVGLLVAALGASPQRAAAAKDWLRLAHRTQCKFPVVMQKVLLDHYCPSSITPETGCLTLAIVNSSLDRLAAIAGNAACTAVDPADERSRLRALTGSMATAQQVEVLRGLLRLCTPLTGRWLLSIILKEDLPIGMGEKILLSAFHPDAFAAFSSCSDLRLVIRGLSQPGSAWKRKEVEPGTVVSPQLAARCDGGAEGAVKRMRGRPFVVETKFDGWRIQLHVTGGSADSDGSSNASISDATQTWFHYFSRNLKDHGRRSAFNVLNAAVAQFLIHPSPAPLAAAVKPAAAGADCVTPGTAGQACEAADSGGQHVRPCALSGQLPSSAGEALTGSRASMPSSALPRVVLDGEMLVWNKRRRCFEPFGLLESTIKAAAEGCEPDAIVKGRDMAATEEGYQHPQAADLEVVYIAFDVLYLGDSSAVHQPLKERQALLGRLLRPVESVAAGSCGIPVGPRGAITFRAEPLLPGKPMHDGRVHSRICGSAEDVQALLDSATEAGEEGIVVKALDDAYRLRARAETWIKIKPDYLTMGEFDAVIIGQLYDHTKSQTSVGGVYLLGLPEAPPQPGRPVTYVTFATVGVGVSREERQHLLEPRLAGNLVPSQLGGALRPERGQAGAVLTPDPAPQTTSTTTPGAAGADAEAVRSSARDVRRAARLRGVPRWCRATGSKDEWPDWWVVDPNKSVVVQVNADQRLTCTSTFATGHTLRFPRITRVRTDKDPAQATTLQELREMVGRLRSRGGGGYANGSAAVIRNARTPAGASTVGGSGFAKRTGPRQLARPPRMSRVPRHLMITDMSKVSVHFNLLDGAYVALEGLYGGRVAERRGELARLVRLLGGRCSANYVERGDCRTSYVVVDEWLESSHGRDGRGVDLLRPAWLEECYGQRRLIMPARPSLAWRLSTTTLAMHADSLDQYGDPYFELLDEQDLAALLERHVPAAADNAQRPQPAPGERQSSRRGPARREPGGACHTAEVRREPRPASVFDTGPRSTAEVLHWLEAEMLAEGEEPPAGPHRLFAGTVALLLDLTPLASAGPSNRCRCPADTIFAVSTPDTGVSASGVRGCSRDGCDGSGLLFGVGNTVAMAARWEAEATQQHLADLRVGMLRGGGRLVERWSSDVTHVILYNGAVEEAAAIEGTTEVAAVLARYTGPGLDAIAVTKTAAGAACCGVGMPTTPAPGLRERGESASLSAADASIADAERLPLPVVVAAEKVLAALRAVCAEPEWTSALSEVLTAAAAAEANSRPNDACNGGAKQAANSADDKELQLGQPPAEGGGFGIGESPGAQPCGRLWRSGLANLIGRLVSIGVPPGGADGTDGGNVDDAGASAVPGGEEADDGQAPLLVDWRWIRDSLRQAGRDTAASPHTSPAQYVAPRVHSAPTPLPGNAAPRAIGQAMPSTGASAYCGENPSDWADWATIGPCASDWDKDVDEAWLGFSEEEADEDEGDDHTISSRGQRQYGSQALRWVALPEALYLPRVVTTRSLTPPGLHAVLGLPTAPEAWAASPPGASSTSGNGQGSPGVQSLRSAPQSPTQRPPADRSHEGWQAQRAEGSLHPPAVSPQPLEAAPAPPATGEPRRVHCVHRVLPGRETKRAECTPSASASCEEPGPCSYVEFGPLRIQADGTPAVRRSALREMIAAVLATTDSDDEGYGCDEAARRAAGGAATAVAGAVTAAAGASRATSDVALHTGRLESCIPCPPATAAVACVRGNNPFSSDPSSGSRSSLALAAYEGRGRNDGAGDGEYGASASKDQSGVGDVSAASASGGLGCRASAEMALGKHNAGQTVALGLADAGQPHRPRGRPAPFASVSPQTPQRVCYLGVTPDGRSPSTPPVDPAARRRRLPIGPYEDSSFLLGVAGSGVQPLEQPEACKLQYSRVRDGTGCRTTLGLSPPQPTQGTLGNTQHIPNGANHAAHAPAAATLLPLGPDANVAEPRSSGWGATAPPTAHAGTLGIGQPRMQRDRKCGQSIVGLVLRRMLDEEDEDGECRRDPEVNRKSNAALDQARRRLSPACNAADDAAGKVVNAIVEHDRIPVPGAIAGGPAGAAETNPSGCAKASASYSLLTFDGLHTREVSAMAGHAAFLPVSTHLTGPPRRDSGGPGSPVLLSRPVTHLGPSPVPVKGSCEGIPAAATLGCPYTTDTRQQPLQRQEVTKELEAPAVLDTVTASCCPRQQHAQGMDGGCASAVVEEREEQAGGRAPEGDLADVAAAHKRRCTGQRTREAVPRRDAEPPEYGPDYVSADGVVEGATAKGGKARKRRRSGQRSWLVVFSALGGQDLDE